METLKSGISGLYIKPLYPNLNDTVIIRAFAGADRVNNLRIAFINFDNIDRVYMRKAGVYSLFDGSYDVYEAEIKACNKEIRYWFEAELSNGSDFYLTKRGPSDFLRAWEDAFVLKINLNVPSWVPETVCYQIFPDRFCNGNPELGAKRGDYEFDGHQITEMKWEDKPLQYNEGFCLDFFNGDLDGIISKADYLKELGVGAVYLNPIGCSRTTHRYDCTDYFHVDPKLGGDDAYIRLIKALHSVGIKVITDISINHTGIDHPWFLSAKNGGPEKAYYFPDGRGGFDCWFNVSTLPQLNYGSEALRKTIYRNDDSVLQKFIREPFCQDGWRLDVATSVGNHNDEHLCHEVWTEVRSCIKAINKEAYLVGEDWDDSCAYLEGDQWDAAMNYVGCSRPLRRWMGEKDRFFCPNNNNPGTTAPYTALQLKNHLERQLSALSGQMVYQQMNLIDSHDQSRLHCHREIFDRELYKGAVMLQFLLPGMPCIYYGDEISIEGPLGSVENCRYPMVWDEKKWDIDIFEFYKALGRLRKDYSPALSEGQWEFGFCDSDLMVFRRVSENQEVVLLMYRGPERRILSERETGLDSSKFKDWFTGEEIKGPDLALEPKTSRIIVCKKDS